ncbi:MAG: Arc family DNA-binding protein [Sulfuricella denitrificans]|nr:Arc family DNA-binding protein [Gammaproteobacteria bacterium]MBU1731015.1 Arc family DNA-binding protein [Gammaproteobacteria bacterium]MBU1893675.1 Arc family DNA-binding protein [Gammaproteobacteria bacterium]MBZ0103998.1 Arc family DNA-binding protein [Sulfuricella denitrificans]
MNLIASKKDQSVTVRFPVGLLDRLDNVARKQGRSRNSEIIKRLDESLEREEVPEEKAA